MTLMAPDTPPSTRSAVALFCTTTEPTSSEGSSEKLLERPTLPPIWFSKNQSPVLMAWPLNSVCCRLGLVPRRLTLSFSPKPPSPPADDCVFTPGKRWMASATFLSGILPMSSAVTMSTTASASRFWRNDCSRAARTPVTTTVCGAVGEVSAACACSAVPIANTVTAAAIAVFVCLCRAIDCFIFSPKYRWGIGAADSLARHRRRPSACSRRMRRTLKRLCPFRIDRIVW